MSSKPSTLGALRESGYQPRSVRREIRANLVERLKGGQRLFPGVLGYDRTVIPGLVNAMLAGHDVILLGLRGAPSEAEREAVEGEIKDMLNEYNPSEEEIRQSLFLIR